MTELCIEVPVENIARMIRGMGEEELETLSILLSDQGQELLKRKGQIDSGQVRLLTRDEVFDV